MATPYDIGDGIRVTATFRNIAGSLDDPTAIVFKLHDPDGTVTTPSVTRVSTGIYYAEFVVNARGTWTYRWEGTGAVIAADEGRVAVKGSVFY